MNSHASFGVAGRRVVPSPLSFVAFLCILLCADAFHLPSPILRGSRHLEFLKNSRHRSSRGRDAALFSANTNVDVGGVNRPSVGNLQPKNDDIHTDSPGDLGAISNNATIDSDNNVHTIKDSNARNAFRKFWEATHTQRKVRAPGSFPWSFWMRVRSAIPIIPVNGIDTPRFNDGSATRKRRKRRWEVPLTSKPFEGVEDLRSTVVRCIVAVALYFSIGIVAFSMWLEPSWTLIDTVYFSMVLLTTVGYGDVVVGTGISEPHAMFAKLFVLAYNIYAVCISVSSLGLIAKLALNQERKIMHNARERARRRFVQILDRGMDGDYLKEGEEEGKNDDQDNEVNDQNTWADRIIDEENKSRSEEPNTRRGALMQAVRRNAFEFFILAIMARLLQKVEGWSLIDVIYYWNCTATTIGFGDICPRTQFGRLIAIAFVPLSVVTLGEIIANVFAFLTSRLAARAEKDFLRREITFTDLEYLDVNDDGKVCELDFLKFMLVAMQKVDAGTIRDVQRLFHAMDAGKNGFIEKEDLITLRQRKRRSRLLKRDQGRRKSMMKVDDEPKKDGWTGWLTGRYDYSFK